MKGVQPTGNDQIVFYTLILYAMFRGVLHEFGHASSAKVFGSQVGSIGAGIYWVYPVLFADVNASWALSRRQRIAVALAGSYMDVLLIGVLGLLYLVWRNTNLLFLAGLSFTAVFINMNPFLKFDGYWVLSDVVGVPNLRNESQRALSRLLRRYPGFRPGRDIPLSGFAIASWLYLVRTLSLFVQSLPSMLNQFEGFLGNPLTLQGLSTFFSILVRGIVIYSLGKMLLWDALVGRIRKNV